MAFDPKKYGATPVETSSFDASKYGATQVDHLDPYQVLSQPSLGQRALQGAGNIASYITQPFASIAATPVQIAAKGLNKITGQNIDPYAGGLPGLGNKRIPISPLSVEAKTGDVLKAGAITAGVATAPASLTGAVLGGVAIGGAEAAGSAMQREAPAGDVLKEGAIGGAIGAAAGGLLYGAGQILKKTGEGIYKAVMPTSTREAKLLQTYKAKTPLTTRIKTALGFADDAAPRTVAKTGFEKGLVGTESMIGVQARRAQDVVWDDVIEPALNSSKKVVNMQEYLDDLGKEVIKTTPELGRQKALLEAVEAMKADYAGVGNVPIAQLQKFKEGWAEFVPDKAYMGKPIAGAFNEVKDMAADKARNTIYSELGKNVKEAYFDYGNLRGIAELGQKAMAGGRLKGGFGGFWSAVKDMTLTPIGTIGGRTVYRTAQGIQLFGRPGALVLSDILSPKILETLQSGKESTPQEKQ